MFSKRDPYLSKDTYKRDTHMWKETYIYEKRPPNEPYVEQQELVTNSDPSRHMNMETCLQKRPIYMERDLQK